jgi:small nuclear ribonucleoprotein (snRNP)-like protein
MLFEVYSLILERGTLLLHISKKSEIKPIIWFCLFFTGMVIDKTLIISGSKLTQMVNGIVLPIKKVFSLVDSKITVEIKDDVRKLQGRLVAVDEYLNIHMEETTELIDNQRGRNLGTVVIRGNNILSIAPST